MTAIQSIQTVAVYVTDLDRSQRFYGDVLGLTPLRQQGRTAYRVGESHLLLHPTEPGETGRHSRLELHLGVDDLDPFIARIGERATPVLQEPVDRPWGEREAIVLDPDGYPVFLVQRAAPQETPSQETAPQDTAATTSAVRRAALRVSCGGNVRVAFDESVPHDEIRSSKGNHPVDGGVRINGGDEDIEVRLHPDLELDLEINAAGAHISDVRRPLDATMNVGDVVISGRFDDGESRLTCNAGAIDLTLQPGSDVRLRVAPHARWQVRTALPAADLGAWVLGSGSAVLDIRGNFGTVTATQE